MDDFEKKLKKGFRWYDIKKTFVQIVLIFLLSICFSVLSFSIYSLWKPFANWENINFGILTGIIPVVITVGASIVIKLMDIRSQTKATLVDNKECIYRELIKEMSSYFKLSHWEYDNIQKKLLVFINNKLSDILLYCHPGVANRCCRLRDALVVVVDISNKPKDKIDNKDKDKKQQAILNLIPEIINAIRKDYGVSLMGEEILRDMLK